MDYTTKFPTSIIDEPELEALVETLRKMTGKNILIEKLYVVTTDDINLSSMLDGLKDSLKETAVEPIKVKANGHKKVRKPRKMKAADDGFKPAPTRGPHVRSIRIVATGEMISRFELDKRLAVCSIIEGTKLHSPKHGTMTVVLTSEGMVLHNEAGELL